MPYSARVWLGLAVIFALGAGSIGALLAAAQGMAAADMHVGKGSSKFPPQHVTAPASARPHAKPEAPQAPGGHP